MRNHNLKFAIATIHSVLIRNGVNRLNRKSRRLRQFKRYQKNIPGKRVQIDVFKVGSSKVGPGKYQYTAFDDCTRYRVLDLQPRKNSKATLRFLEEALSAVVKRNMCLERKKIEQIEKVRLRYECD